MRSEFLYLDRSTAPTDDEQTQIYSDISAALNGQPLNQTFPDEDSVMTLKKKNRERTTKYDEPF
nr:putative PEP-binding protein [Thiocystis minor]